MSNREILAKILMAFAEYYGQTLTPNQVAMFVEDLSELTPEELRIACKAYRTDPKHTRMPLPAQLVAIARPIQSVEDRSKEVAARIIGAVRTCGYTNPARAKDFIGEDGWRAVQMTGGWVSLCESITNDMIPTTQAQLRELIASMSRGERAEARRTGELTDSRIGTLLQSTALKQMPKITGESE